MTGLEGVLIAAHVALIGFCIFCIVVVALG